MKPPSLTQREQRILVLAVAVAVVFVVVNAWPAVTALHQARGDRIEALRAGIEREQRLAEEEAQWRERRERIEATRRELGQYLFTETTTPLLSASIQRLVREHANAAGVSIAATRLAESLEAGDWLLVEQTVSFTLRDQNDTLDFLRRLDESRPWLGVSRFSMRSNRNQYAGDLTVVGFARLDGRSGAETVARND